MRASFGSFTSARYTWRLLPEALPKELLSLISITDSTRWIFGGIEDIANG
jgi:hypothetical protein